MTCEDTPYEFLVDRSMECVADEAVCNCKDSNNKIICRVNGIEITYYKCKCECLCTNFQIIYPTEKELFSPYKYICNNSKVNFECNKLRRPNDDDNKDAMIKIKNQLFYFNVKIQDYTILHLININFYDSRYTKVTEGKINKFIYYGTFFITTVSACQTKISLSLLLKFTSKRKFWESLCELIGNYDFHSYNNNNYNNSNYNNFATKL
ncbi:hypothetical protein U3516DRAFT_737293 [Neocallimastix sp. 'constans']